MKYLLETAWQEFKKLVTDPKELVRIGDELLCQIDHDFASMCVQGYEIANDLRDMDDGYWLLAHDYANTLEEVQKAVAFDMKENGMTPERAVAIIAYWRKKDGQTDELTVLNEEAGRLQAMLESVQKRIRDIAGG